MLNHTHLLIIDNKYSNSYSCLIKNGGLKSGATGVQWALMYYSNLAFETRLYFNQVLSGLVLHQYQIF